ncbi:zinc metalloprotease [gamma proteobacterium HTCC5015]|nr:zinc metalloprotease [gamma proteobacterium HTCC5015]
MVEKKSEYLDGNGFIVEVLRTDRKKTADIRVEEGAVSVVVPRNTTEARINELIREKRRWIKRKMALHQEQAPVTEKRMVSGEAFAYLGRHYRLKVVRGPYAPVKLSAGRLLVTVPQGTEQPHIIRNALIRWYKRQADIKLTDKVRRFAPRVGVEPAGVAIKSFRSRWGSCTAKGSLEFNWRIMMAPNSVVDYVVLHELCHLLHHNHSQAFWDQLRLVAGDYQSHKDWLKEHSVRLAF